MSDRVHVAVVILEGAAEEALASCSRAGGDLLITSDVRSVASAGAEVVIVVGVPARVADAVEALAEVAPQLTVAASLRRSDVANPLAGLAQALAEFRPDADGISGADAEALSHDLRTPLGSILLRVGRLLGSCADERLTACEAFGEFPRQLEIVRQEAERCAELLAALDRPTGSSASSG
jgi:signal transduction histidine kinase